MGCAGWHKGDVMPEIKGSCHCGKVGYHANAEPLFTFVCHCTTCQKATGSAFGVMIALPAAALTINGITKTYEIVGDSGKPKRHRFCPECGSGLMNEGDIMPGVVIIFAGTLDDASWLKPTRQIYCDSAQPWVSLGGDMQRFTKATRSPPAPDLP
jgi:hypothetical protein